MAIDFNKLSKRVSKKTAKVVGKALDEGSKLANEVASTTSKATENVIKSIHSKDDVIDMSMITKEGALKIIYLLMAVDKQIKDKELEEYKLIANEIDNNYDMNVITNLQNDICKLDNDDYFDDLLDYTKNILNESLFCAGGEMSMKLLLWDLYAIAYSDNDIHQDEMRLIRYIARQAKIDKSIMLEYENSIKTLQAIEKEQIWLKESNKSYNLVDSKVKELDKRKKNIMDSVMIFINE